MNNPTYKENQTESASAVEVHPVVMSDRETLFKDTLEQFSEQLLMKCGTLTGKMSYGDAQNVLSAALAQAISRT